MKRTVGGYGVVQRPVSKRLRVAERDAEAVGARLSGRKGDRT